MVPGHEIAGVVVGRRRRRHQVQGRRPRRRRLHGRLLRRVRAVQGRPGEVLRQERRSGPTTTQGYDGEPTMGGYAQQVVVSERFAVRIPDGHRARRRRAAAVRRHHRLLAAQALGRRPRHARSPSSVSAASGHMGVKIAGAMGADVTVLSQGMSKRPTAARSVRRTTARPRTAACSRTSRPVRPHHQHRQRRASTSTPTSGCCARSASSSTSACRPGAVGPLRLPRRRRQGAGRVQHRRHRARRRRCWTSAPSTASARRSRRSRADRGRRRLRPRRRRRRALPLRHRHLDHPGRLTGAS